MINKTINVNICVPENEFCNGCDFMTNIINLYSEPKCIVFKQKLKWTFFDKYVKCKECLDLCNDEDEE